MKVIKKSSTLVFLLSILIIFILGCKKKTNFDTRSSSKLDFSSTQIFFDTVFTTLSSTTQRFKIYNRQNESLKISTIQLGGLENSPYRINIDGDPGGLFSDIEIAANDSLFGFVEVTIDPLNSNSPLVVEDSIVFLTNGNIQKVDLIAYGQDAYYHNNELVEGLWSNDKPHVCFGITAVGFPGLDSNKTLTIMPGTDVYMHNEATLLVYKSTLNSNGSLGSEVEFKAYRQEDYYQDVAGQYRGLLFIQSNNSILNYTDIVNANIGIQVDTLFDINTNALTVQNCKVHNSFTAGVYVNAGARVVLENSLFTNSDQYLGYFANGGNFNVKHCTFANYIGHSQPALVVSNYFESEGVRYVRPILNSRFDNCIFYGVNQTEFTEEVDLSSPVDLVYNSSLFKTEEVEDFQNNPRIINPILNQDPAFLSAGENDFNLFSISPAINYGDPSFTLPLDLDGNTRDAQPDLGCYEAL